MSFDLLVQDSEGDVLEVCQSVDLPIDEHFLVYDVNQENVSGRVVVLHAWVFLHSCQFHLSV